MMAIAAAIPALGEIVQLSCIRVFLIVIVLCPTIAGAAEPTSRSAQRDPLDRLRVIAEPDRELRLDPATGTPSTVVILKGALRLDGDTLEAKAEQYLSRFKDAYGVKRPDRDLALSSRNQDRLGRTSLGYRQFHRGVPVFGAMLRLHFDETGELRAVNGLTVPDLDVDTTPRVQATSAAKLARQSLAKRHGLSPDAVASGEPELMTFRTGLVRGVSGRDRLVWRVEVHSGGSLGEQIFVDAGDGRVVDRISTVHEISRRVHDGRYPNEIWREGDPVPYTGFADPNLNNDVNNVIDSALETYQFFLNLTGGDYESFDGRDGTMDSVVNWEDEDCPNAAWNGRRTLYCAGLAVDDIIAHEWTHGYTQYTHDLIYQWQPGAVNEAFSDIFGEVVDQLNGTGLDSPDTARLVGDCTSAAIEPAGANLEIETAVAASNGAYSVWRANFNPTAPWSASGPLELVDDGAGTATDACEPLIGFSAGAIAVIDRGECNFVDKVQRAADAGAVAAVIANNADDGLVFMGGDPPSPITIPAVFVTKADGDRIKASLADGADASLWRDAVAQSVRWLMAEDSQTGVIRDMWNPSCIVDPPMVSSSLYWCSDEDNGGVHHNSAIPNHAFALLVDGGRHNGVDVSGIGLTKAAHIYWRAMSVYQVPTTGFAEHADALELSCSDLIGQQLADLVTGAPSDATIAVSDCRQVANAMASVGMRTETEICNFEPLLANPPPTIAFPHVAFSDDFESDPAGRWSFSNEGVFDEYVPRDWQWTDDLADDRPGRGLHAINSNLIGNCTTDDQSGVQWAVSPAITLPVWTTSAVLVFDHYVATEEGWDGGNLSLSVNGGEYRAVPTEAFLFNPYNDSITDVAEIDDQQISNTNPLAGEPGYTGVDDGRLGGSWGQTQIDLTTVAGAGDTVRIRFNFGVDGCTGVEGWYVDDLKVLTDEPRSLQRRRLNRGLKPLS